MINNKIITITKKNEFDRGWTLFRIFTPEQTVKRKDMGITVSAVITKITRADKIGIILSEPCLSSHIVKELEWVSKYIDIELIAKNEEIQKFYSARIKLKNVKINPSITVNCLGIISKEPMYLLINNGFSEVGSEIYDTYFSGKKSSVSLELSDVHNVYICLDSEKAIDINYLEKFKNNGANVYCAIPKECYCKSVYSMLKGKGIGLLVADVRKRGTLITNKSGELFQIHTLENETEFKERLFSIFDYITGMYECLFLPEVIDYNNVDFPNEVYVADGKNIKRLLLKPNIKVNITVNAKDMLSFVNETFDSSVTEKHNDYSAEAKEVEYIFELCPPCLPASAETSKIYSGLSEGLKKWNALSSPIIERCKKDISLIAEKTKIYYFCDMLERYELWLKKAIYKYEFKSFSSKLVEFKGFLEDSKKELISYVGEVYSSLGVSADSGKFDKFDAEIAGYEQTIAEKQMLIKQNKEILQNKRRIDILQKKINDLLELKKQFENNSSERNDKAVSVFLTRCKAYVNGVQNNQNKENSDSLENIVKTKEKSKETLLEVFAKEHLHPLNKLLEEYISVIIEMCDIDIPDDYTVYEAEGKRMIVIDDVKEFEKTKEIQEKYNLCCVVRR